MSCVRFSSCAFILFWNSYFRLHMKADLEAIFFCVIVQIPCDITSAKKGQWWNPQPPSNSPYSEHASHVRTHDEVSENLIWLISGKSLFWKEPIFFNSHRKSRPNHWWKAKIAIIINESGLIYFTELDSLIWKIYLNFGHFRVACVRWY